MQTAVFVRDRIVLDDTFRSRLVHFIAARQLLAGDTLVVAAEQMSGPAAGAFKLLNPIDLPVGNEPLPAPPIQIVLVAGEISSAEDLDFSGQDGTAAVGRTIRVYGQSVQSLRIRARGGTGRKGPTGEPGLNGHFDREWDPESHSWLMIPVRPTAGGTGGTGGTGGNGGSIGILWASGSEPIADVSGGAGGEGGDGGKGGRGLLQPRQPDAPDGPQGADGPVGPPGPAHVEQLPLDQLWAQARQDLGSQAAAEVAAHWVRVAEYRFRQVSGTPTAAELGQISALLDLALSIDPDNQDKPADKDHPLTAATLKGQLLGGYNALNLLRNLDVIPEFNRYAERYNQNAAGVNDLFNFAQALLQDMTTGLLEEAKLNAQRESLARHREVLRLELDDAQRDLAVAKIELSYATNRWDAIVQEVNKKKAEIEQASIDWGGVIVVGLGALVSVLFTVGSGGAGAPLVMSILSSVPGLLKVADLTFTGSKEEEKLLADAVALPGKVVTAAKGGKELAESADPNGTVDVNKLVKESGVLLIDMAKLVKDLSQATGAADLKKLVQEQAVRLHDKLLAKAQVEDAQRAVDIVNRRLANSDADIEQYTELFNQAKTDANKLKNVVLGLLAAARPYADLLLRYQFRAARAVEIYTLQDASGQQRFGYGHVHPDDEADFRDDFISPGQLRDQLIASRQTGFAVLMLSTQFDEYMEGDFTSDTHYVMIDAAAEIQRFRTSGLLTFLLLPDDLAGKRYEAKVTGVWVVLQGATAQTPTFPMIVTHSGRSLQLRRDATTADQSLRARKEAVQVMAPAAGQNWLVGSIAAEIDRRRVGGFWGRGVAATWSFDLEPEVILARGVDLTQLQSISIGLNFDCFL